ncbi:PrsW family glutamic-type intramembrane protease [Streptococcus pluranimalium]|uniref:PrsW family glutamic-type intramembrane protease n=1 Tax=Streptococcus pluranimalium TaxID=82348 RepID=UPI0039FBD9F7
MKRYFLLLTLGLLSLWRLAEELLILLTLSQERHSWLSFIVAIAILIVVYVIPISVLVIVFLGKKGLSYKEYFYTIIFGALLLGQVAGLLNFKVSDMLLTIFDNVPGLEGWIPSIVPPLVEESLKFVLAVILLYLFRINSVWEALSLGAGVGLGFQLSEDYTYVLGTLVDNHGAPISEALVRLSGSFASHWLLTALMTGAWFLLAKIGVKKVIAKCYVIIPMLLHAIWNTSVVDGSLLLKGLLTIMSWGLLFYFYQTTERIEKHQS